MLTLIIETCTEKGVIGIFNGNDCLFESFLPFGYNQSHRLMPEIEQAFAVLKMNPQQIDLIAVGNGPGSYTGIRVGASVAKTLAFVCEKPLIGISTLYSFLPECDMEVEFAAIIDAKTCGCYLLQGHWNGKQAIYSYDPELIPLESLGVPLNETKILVTPRLAGLKLKLDRLYPNNSWQWNEVSPNLRLLNQMAQKMFAHGKASLNGYLSISYLRGNLVF